MADRVELLVSIDGKAFDRMMAASNFQSNLHDDLCWSIGHTVALIMGKDIDVEVTGRAAAERATARHEPTAPLLAPPKTDAYGDYVGAHPLRKLY